MTELTVKTAMPCLWPPEPDLRQRMNELKPDARLQVDVHLRYLERAAAFRELRNTFDLNWTAMVARLGYVAAGAMDALHQEARAYQRYEEPLEFGLIPKTQPAGVSVIARALAAIASEAELSESKRFALERANNALLLATAREYIGRSVGILRMLVFELGDERLDALSGGRLNQSKMKAACDRDGMVQFAHIAAVYRNMLASEGVTAQAFPVLSENTGLKRAFAWCTQELAERRGWPRNLALLRHTFDLLGVDTTETQVVAPFPKGLGISANAALALSAGNIVFWPQLKRGLNEFLVQHQAEIAQAAFAGLRELIEQVDADYSSFRSANAFETMASRSLEAPWSRAALTKALAVEPEALENAVRGHPLTESCPRAALAALLARDAGEAAQFVSCVRAARFGERNRVIMQPPSHCEIERDIWGLNPQDMARLPVAIGVQVRRAIDRDGLSAGEDLKLAEEVQKLGVALKLRPALHALAGIQGSSATELMDSLFSLPRTHPQFKAQRKDGAVAPDVAQAEPVVFPIQGLFSDPRDRNAAAAEARAFIDRERFALPERCRGRNAELVVVAKAPEPVPNQVPEEPSEPITPKVRRNTGGKTRAVPVVVKFELAATPPAEFSLAPELADACLPERRQELAEVLVRPSATLIETLGTANSEPEKSNLHTAPEPDPAQGLIAVAPTKPLRRHFSALIQDFVTARPLPYAGYHKQGQYPLSFFTTPALNSGPEQDVFSKLAVNLQEQHNPFGIAVIKKLLDGTRSAPLFGELELRAALGKLREGHAQEYLVFSITPEINAAMLEHVSELLEQRDMPLRERLQDILNDWEKSRLAAWYVKDTPTCRFDLLGRELYLLSQRAHVRK